MRVNSVFNQLLKIPSASVSDVTITDTNVEVRLRLRARTLTCECGYSTHATYDRARRRWRHRNGAAGMSSSPSHRDFEDAILRLAQRVDRTCVATLMRCAWETVTAITIRAVDEWIDEQRLKELHRIGVDEICYRHPNH